MTPEFDIAAHCRTDAAAYRRVQELVGPTVVGSVYAAALDDAANEVAYCILDGGERAGVWETGMQMYESTSYIVFFIEDGDDVDPIIEAIEDREGSVEQRNDTLLEIFWRQQVATGLEDMPDGRVRPKKPRVPVLQAPEDILKAQAEAELAAVCKLYDTDPRSDVLHAAKMAAKDRYDQLQGKTVTSWRWRGESNPANPKRMDVLH